MLKLLKLDLSKLLLEFAKNVLRISSPLPIKTNVKFGQDF